MIVPQNKTRIVFFIGSLDAGGKERRLVELLTYLSSKGCYEMLVLLTSNVIHFQNFIALGIPYQVLPKAWQRNDPTVIYQFYKYCKMFKPDLIHTWGQMQSFYALPTVALESITLINSQITSAPPSINKLSLTRLLDRVIFTMSTVILSNSKAGLQSFKPPKHKSKVIYNGMNLNRFNLLENSCDVKTKYWIKTKYAVAMVASISPNKDYKMFYEVGLHVTALRDDITFIGLGDYLEGDHAYEQVRAVTHNNPRLIFAGNVSDVESLVNACDLGMLLSPNGEGISNAILEYMALGKPVIASNKGGTPEIVEHNVNGYLVEDHDTTETIASYVIDLIDDKEKRAAFGKVSRNVIYDNFSIDRMGHAFEQVYQSALLKKINLLPSTPVCSSDSEALSI